MDRSGDSCGRGDCGTVAPKITQSLKEAGVDISILQEGGKKLISSAATLKRDGKMLIKGDTLYEIYSRVKPDKVCIKISSRGDMVQIETVRRVDENQKKLFIQRLKRINYEELSARKLEAELYKMPGEYTHRNGQRYSVYKLRHNQKIQGFRIDVKTERDTGTFIEERYYALDKKEGK